MDRASLEQVLRLVGARNIGSSGESHIKLSCLVGHRNGSLDETPSMTVSVSSSSASWFYCHGCMWASPLVDLIAYLFRRNGRASYEKLLAWAIKHDGPVRKLATGGLREPPKQENNYTSRLKALMRHEWPKDAIEFLNSKGVSLKTAKAFKCAWEPASRAIVLPVLSRTETGKFRCVAAQARKIDEKVLFSIFEGNIWHKFFGENFIPNEGAPRPILVEGAFDVMHLHELGLFSLGLMGKGINFLRLSRIRKELAPRRVHLMLDPDTRNDVELWLAVKERFSEINSTGEKLRYTAHELDRDPKYLTRDEALKHIGKR